MRTCAAAASTAGLRPPRTVPGAGPVRWCPSSRAAPVGGGAGIGGELFGAGEVAGVPADGARARRRPRACCGTRCRAGRCRRPGPWSAPNRRSARWPARSGPCSSARSTSVTPPTARRSPSAALTAAIDSAASSITHQPRQGVGDRVQQPGGAPGPRQMPGDHHTQLGPVLLDRPRELGHPRVTNGRFCWVCHPPRK